MSRLIVLVPSIRGDLKDWSELVTRLKAEPSLTGSRWEEWPHGMTWFKLRTPSEVARRLTARINELWVAYGPYDEIILVGHSFGGLLVREAYLRASGADPDFPQVLPWAAAVRRIILFSAINRGIPTADYVPLRIFTWFARVLPPLRKLLGWHVLSGSDFITNLRIRWMRHFAQIARPPVIVQLRGADDKDVGREDSYDMEQFRSAYYIEVPGAVHKDLFHLTGAIDPEARYRLLRDSFVHAQPECAENIEVTGAKMVVLIVHGIRANNRTWAQQVADDIRARWPASEVHPVPFRYEMVSAAQFAFPPTRKRRLRDFKDVYSDALARNPNAEFNFIGHSNGTYLLGESLRAIPGMCFNRVALVGSVLPEDFDWDRIVRRGQVHSLRVDGSSSDWPVGWLCAGLRCLGQKTVGTGGFLGFTALPSSQTKQEYFWYQGGHGAPLAADNLPALADFAVAGTISPPAILPGKIRWWFALTSTSLRKYTFLPALILAALWLWLATQHWIAAGILLAVAALAIIVLDII